MSRWPGNETRYPLALQSAWEWARYVYPWYHMSRWPGNETRYPLALQSAWEWARYVYPWYHMSRWPGNETRYPLASSPCSQLANVARNLFAACLGMRLGH